MGLSEVVYTFNASFFTTRRHLHRAIGLRREKQNKFNSLPPMEIECLKIGP